MKPAREPRLSARERQAVDEIKALVLQRFPEATFEVARFPEEHEGIEIWMTVDLDDPEEPLSGLLRDRLDDLLIQEGLFILVIPVPTPERARKHTTQAWEAYRRRQRAKASA